MRKTIKQLLAFGISAAIAVSAAAVSVSACGTAQLSAQSYSDAEGTITVDLSKGTTVTVDTSDLPSMNAVPFSSLLLYTGSVNFGTSGNTVKSPVLTTPFDSENDQLKFKPSNFSGDKKIDITLYTHFNGDSSSTYTSHELGKLTFSALVSYRILFSGSAASNIDKVYLVFTPHDDCATSFSYEVSLV